MTRIEEIDRLRGQYEIAMRLGKRKQASLIQARLQSLVTRQIRSENRKAKAA